MAVPPGVELADRYLLADGVNAVAQVPQDLFHLLAEGNIIPLAAGDLVRGYQFSGIHELRFAAGIRVLVSVSSVFSPT